MSLLPMESRLVHGLAPELAEHHNAEPYSVVDARPCAVPGCTKAATDGHHIWRRSFLAGAFDWVVVEELDSLIVPNKVGLCHDHHMVLDSSIGGQKAFIVAIPADQPDIPESDPVIEFFWITRAQYEAAGGSDPYTRLFIAALEPDGGDRLLDPQPGPRGALEGAPRSASQDADQGATVPMQTTVDGGEVPHTHVVNENGVEKTCSKCKGRGKVIEKEKDPDQPQAPARTKVTWSVRVPKDERENGYELLTALMESAVERAVELELVRDNNSGANYYVLLAALRKFVVGESE